MRLLFVGVSKKNRRKFTYKNRIFYWSVREALDEDRLELSIISEDKHFIVHYFLGQRDKNHLFVPENPFITVIGKEFKGFPNMGHTYKRFIVPNWEDITVTPKLVEEILDWCFKEEPVQEVDFRGTLLKK